uniref:Secreted protein n=1 Tax=Rhipicephalus appendiculatus TaxID=34631 RepID=A0A131YAI2_RHIAP
MVFFFFFFSLLHKPMPLFHQAATCIAKTSKTCSHRLFRYVCISVVAWPSFFTSRSLAPEFVAYLCDVSFTKASRKIVLGANCNAQKCKGDMGVLFI